MIHDFGKYLLFIAALFKNRLPFKIYYQQTIIEAMRIGIHSVGLIAFIALFMGAVTAIQTAYNLQGPLFQNFLLGLIVRDMTILELAPTITSLVFAGKVGSSMAGEIGTMRITEQIDALEIMGINAKSYLVLPKICATIWMYPLLVILSAFLSIYGGLLISSFLNLVPKQDFIVGLRMHFSLYNIFFALAKSCAFAFLIASIATYRGFYTFGGALAVGKASTQAVTHSCMAILITDYLLAQLLL